MSKKNIIIIIIIAILGALIFWKRDFIKRKLGMGSDPASDGGSSDSNSSDVPVTPGLTYTECKTFPLKLGCKGKNVQTIQRALNKLHGAGLKEDGYFGPKTETVLAANGYGETVEKEDMDKMVKELIAAKS